MKLLNGCMTFDPSAKWPRRQMARKIWQRPECQMNQASDAWHLAQMSWPHFLVTTSCSLLKCCEIHEIYFQLRKSVSYFTLSTRNEIVSDSRTYLSFRKRTLNAENGPDSLDERYDRRAVRTCGHGANVWTRRGVSEMKTARHTSCCI